jgi:hypothetical protein
VAVIGDGDARTDGRRAHRHHATAVEGQHARFAVARDDEPLVLRFIADGDQRFATRQPLAVPIAYAVCNPVLANGALPQREREQLAARFDREAVAGRRQLEAGEILRRGDELCRAFGRRRPGIEEFGASVRPGWGGRGLGFSLPPHAS